MKAKTSKIRNGSTVMYSEPFENQVGIKYKVITDVVNEWCTLETVIGTKSTFVANVQDLKLV